MVYLYDIVYSSSTPFYMHCGLDTIERLVLWVIYRSGCVRPCQRYCTAAELCESGYVLYVPLVGVPSFLRLALVV